MDIKRKGLTLSIFEDTIESPREYYKDSNICKMVCFHSRYDLGDENDFESPNDFNEWLTDNKDKIAFITPLYLLDHSGLALSTYDFYNKWDSGQVGYAYVLKEDIKDYDNDDIKNKVKEEVEEYSSWLEGYPKYYAFQVTDEDDNLIDAMGIFELTSREEMIEEMKERSEHKFDFLFDTLMANKELAL